LKRPEWEASPQSGELSESDTQDRRKTRRSAQRDRGQVAIDSHNPIPHPGRLLRRTHRWDAFPVPDPGCGCEVPLADDWSCRAAARQLFTLESTAAREAGIDYDDACTQSTLTAWETDGCGSKTDASSKSCTTPCQRFHGNGEAGDRCRWYGNFHHCDQGLRCEHLPDGSDICVDPLAGPLSDVRPPPS
jgi:hypothetical protein